MQCVMKLFASFAIRRCQPQDNKVRAVSTKLHEEKFGVLEAELKEDKLKNHKFLLTAVAKRIYCCNENRWSSS